MDQESQKIQNPVTNNPQLVQILGRAGFIVTNNDVIIQKKNQLILRKRINGENPDGSPKYYDVPLQLSATDFAAAAKEFPVQATADQMHNLDGNEITLDSKPEPEPAEENIHSATINAVDVSVGQVLQSAPHIAVIRLLKKAGGIHAILLNIRSGKELTISVPELERIESLAALEQLF